MNVNSIVSKITKHAETIGIAGGALAYGLDNITRNLELLTTEGHIPDIGQTVKELFRGANREHMKSAAMLYIGGYAADALGFKREGNVAKKFAVGYVKGLTLQHVLYMSTHASGKSFPEDSLRRERAMYDRVVLGRNAFETPFARSG